MTEEIKELVKRIDALVQQNEILIQILLTRPQNPNYDWFDLIGKINREKCMEIARNFIAK